MKNSINIQYCSTSTGCKVKTKKYFCLNYPVFMIIFSAVIDDWDIFPKLTWWPFLICSFLNPKFKTFKICFESIVCSKPKYRSVGDPFCKKSENSQLKTHVPTPLSFFFFVKQQGLLHRIGKNVTFFAIHFLNYSFVLTKMMVIKSQFIAFITSSAHTLDLFALLLTTWCN